MSAVRWWRWVLAAGLVIACILAAACSGPRSGASATSGVSGCAAVLPLARSVVHDEGTLIEVRRISRSEADALSRQLGVNPVARPRSRPAVPNQHRPVRSPGWPHTCLVVYRGDYPAGTIAGASPPAVAGRYVLIVLRVRHPAVDRILVTDRLPAGVHS
ncbi:MAG TPA: hypothetical protein VFA63_00785 [Pseudonocardiaceae bacterium]|jgi:hypothetical protein|nr:hypothetical protein [Pseudonocardiaceae bacterium]